MGGAAGGAMGVVKAGAKGRLTASGDTYLMGMVVVKAGAEGRFAANEGTGLDGVGVVRATDAGFAEMDTVVGVALVVATEVGGMDEMGMVSMGTSPEAVVAVDTEDTAP